MTEILINRTGQPELVAASNGSLTVTVPIWIKKRGLHKTVTLPDSVGLDSRPWDTTPTPIQLALARGHRWLAKLKSGDGNSMKNIARREGDDDSYVSRMANLITLAPYIVARVVKKLIRVEISTS